ncbi:MAG: GxxExxY protein [Coraliomargarita sp.]
MTETKILYKDESYQIIGACFEVYKVMGPGFLEAVYQECLAKELKLREIPFAQKKRIQLSYKSDPLEQYYEADFVCYDKIIIEIKAHKSLADGHRTQTLHYLKSTGLQLGLLVNFGHHPKLEHERFVNGSRVSRL